jgi:hypothetical protein
MNCWILIYYRPEMLDEGENILVEVTTPDRMLFALSDAGYVYTGNVTDGLFTSFRPKFLEPLSVISETSLARLQQDFHTLVIARHHRGREYPNAPELLQPHRPIVWLLANHDLENGLKTLWPTIPHSKNNPRTD